MHDLSLLYSVTKQFFDTWKSEDWSEDILQKAIHEKNAPCASDDFGGDCSDCPLNPECFLVYEIEDTLHRTKLDEVMEAFTKREQHED